MPRITIHQPGRTPQPYRFDLAIDVVKFGRGGANEIILGCGSISSNHAEMVRVPGGFELRDLASTNGVIKDGERIDACRLSDGDYLSLGDVGFHFELSEDELTTLAAEVEAHAVTMDELPEPHPTPLADTPLRQRNVPGGIRIPGWCVILAFLVLGLMAFYLGASMRHKNETGVTLGHVFKKRLTTPDINRITAITGENPDDVFIRRSSENEEEPLVIAPLTVEESPPEVEDSEMREKPRDHGDEENSEYVVAPMDDDEESDNREDGDDNEDDGDEEGE